MRIFALGFLILTATAFDAASALPFTPPPESAIPKSPFGDSLRRGMAIFTDTQKKSRPYVGNGLNCSNCHLDHGRRAGAAPMWAAWTLYPAFRTKNNKVNTMALRIQECFRYSMNGKMPPSDSAVITDLEAYFFWLAKGAPTGEKLPGQGYPDLPPAKTAANALRGQQEFTQRCAGCHGADGNGNKDAGFPPLWGPRSFNKGAGMYQAETLARFIRANMPVGQEGSVSPEQARDIAAYIESKPRPADPRGAAGNK
jgi:thiosulfate dehydrogenase